MWYTKRFPFADMCLKDTSSRGLRKLAEMENSRQWQDVFNRLVSIAINIFEWENLPETCDNYFLESVLLWNANACIIKDPKTNAFLSLPCTSSSNMNVYYENTYWKAFSVNYSERFLALTKWNKNIVADVTQGFDEQTDQNITIPLGVVCHDNPAEYPLIETVSIYTDKIVDTMRAIDVVTKQLKLGALIETDEDSKTAIQQAVNAIDANVIAVYARRDIAKTIKDSRAISVGSSPAVLESLWNHYNNLYSGFLTAFGINNLNTGDKKERLLTDEVNSNNEQIELNSAYRLDQRLHFCENFNSIFGTNISCRLRHEYEAETQETDTSEEKKPNSSSKTQKEDE